MMDTPPPKRRATLRDTYAGDHQLVSAGDGAQLVSDGDGAQLVGAGDGDGAHGSPSCAGDGDGAHGRHKRGRPKGSTKERLEILREHDEIADDGDNQQRSRARMCRDVAVARWSRVLAKQQHVEAADAAGSSRDIVVHPMVDQSKLVVVPSRAMENTELAVGLCRCIRPFGGERHGMLQGDSWHLYVVLGRMQCETDSCNSETSANDNHQATATHGSVLNDLHANKNHCVVPCSAWLLQRALRQRAGFALLGEAQI